MNSTQNIKTKEQTITEIMFNDTKVSNPDDIAHIFNEYFINIGLSLSLRQDTSYESSQSLFK